MDAPPTAWAQGGPTVRRRLLGAHLRRLREEQGVTRSDAARVIRGSESKISRLELGRLTFKERDVEDLLSCYGVVDPGICAAILAEAQEANARGWWRTYSDVLPTWFEQYVGLESAASLIRTYEAQFIPGLLQTEDYTHAVTRAGQLHGPSLGVVGDHIERRVDLRSTRQQLLTCPDGPRLWAIIDEGALRRQIGGRHVMRAQVEHLLQLQGRPNITIQVMPFGFGGHVAQVGAFTILRFIGDDLPDVVYLEHLTGALYLDAREDTDRYREVFARLAVDSQRSADSAAALVKILSGD
jgi:transcriptional regulator with XRE-family HTH domain